MVRTDPFRHHRQVIGHVQLFQQRRIPDRGLPSARYTADHYSIGSRSVDHRGVGFRPAPRFQISSEI